MRDKIPELPEDGETLLKEVKMARPMVGAFGDYWEAKGRELALTLALWEVEAGHLHAAGVSEEDLLWSVAPGAPTEGAKTSASAAEAGDTLEESHYRASGGLKTLPSPRPKM